jgi:hypothetical protein
LQLDQVASAPLGRKLFFHVDDIVPGLQLASDVRLKAGSFLITRKELNEGRLSEEVIESIRRFASQVAPQANHVEVVVDEFALNHLAGLLHLEVASMIEEVRSDKGPYPNFITDGGLEEKIQKIVAKLLANPDLIKQVYSIKLLRDGDYASQLSGHTMRVTLLALALGLQLKLSIISLINLGIAGIFHDLGMLKLKIYPKLEKLNDYSPHELEQVVTEHEALSRDVFKGAHLTLLPFTKKEIDRIIACHHRPDFEDSGHKLAALLYFAELVDEMLAPFPYKARFNFTPAEIRILGDRFTRRQGLVNVLMALVKLHRKAGGFKAQVVEALLELFNMNELAIDGYEEKLREIVEASIYKAAVPYPNMGGNSLPRTIYCSSSLNSDFSCPNLGQSSIEIIIAGKARSYKRCSELTNRLTELNSAGRKKADKEPEAKNKNQQSKDAALESNKTGRDNK